MLKDMIFPLCEKLGQTIIFVRSRETARSLHSAARFPAAHPGSNCQSQTLRAQGGRNI